MNTPLPNLNNFKYREDAILAWKQSILRDLTVYDCVTVDKDEVTQWYLNVINLPRKEKIQQKIQRKRKGIHLNA